jgi:DNA-binding NtrC family response regulator
MKQARVLVVDDDKVALKTMCRILTKEGHDVTGAGGGARAVSLLAESRFDLVITDLVMNEINGLDLLSRVKRKDPEAEVIVITGHASIATAIEAIKGGAYHYVEKPVRPDEVRHLAARALERIALRRRVRELEERATNEPARPRLVGESRQIEEVVRLIEQVAPADCNVLVTGESGTGKELVASLIHHRSRRREARFLAINCGAFAEGLLANELFGHEREAFTGASRARAGLLESASGGTLFLDEVGDMPLSMQAKLLRALEEHEVIRVGGTRTIPIDVRVIAATNQDLNRATDAGLFRRDLYFRLNVVSIAVPPLRERRKDIPLLAHLFLDRAAKRAEKRFAGFSDEAMSVLTEYSFPGNVRELENVVERAVVVASGDTIRLRDLPPDLTEMDVFSFERRGSGIRTLREMQSDYILWVLERVGRNKTKAAELLGIDRSSLWRHLKEREIEE